MSWKTTLSRNWIIQEEALRSPWYRLAEGKRPFCVIERLNNQWRVQYVAAPDGKKGVTIYPKSRIVPWDLPIPDDINELINNMEMETETMTDTLYSFKDDEGKEVFCKKIAVNSEGKAVVEVKGSASNPYVAVDPKSLKEVLPPAIKAHNILSKNDYFYLVDTDSGVELEVGMFIVDNRGEFLEITEVGITNKNARNYLKGHIIPSIKL